MATSKVIYQDKLRTVCEHLDSGAKIITDAPKDNNGEGKSFSPTDCLATSLASCMLTIIGIRAKKGNIEFYSGTAEVTKHMANEPRMVSAIDIKLELEGIFSETDKVVLEKAGRNCPVALSLHPGIKQNISVIFKEKQAQ